MNRFISSLLIVLVITSATPLIAQVISAPEARETVLNGMETVLSNKDREASSFGEVRSPFVAVVPKIPVVVEKKTEAPKPVVAEVLPDPQALAAISQRFKPLGSLVLGNRGLLQMQNNQTIEKGSSFKAEIKGTVYEVLVSDVTERGYTLQLGDAQISKNFLTASGITQ